jgi:hypothetical protein
MESRHGEMEMEAWKYADIELRHGNMEKWRHGDMVTWRLGDMKTWRHKSVYMFLITQFFNFLFL